MTRGGTDIESGLGTLRKPPAFACGTATEHTHTAAIFTRPDVEAYFMMYRFRLPVRRCTDCAKSKIVANEQNGNTLQVLL